MAIAFAAGVQRARDPDLALPTDKPSVAILLPQGQVVVEEVGDGKFPDKGLVQKRPLGRRRIPIRRAMALQRQPIVLQILTLGRIWGPLQQKIHQAQGLSPVPALHSPPQLSVHSPQGSL